MFRNEEINVFEKRSKANIHYTLDGLISRMISLLANRRAYIWGGGLKRVILRYTFFSKGVCDIVPGNLKA